MHLLSFAISTPSTFQYMKSGTNRTHQFKKYEYHYNVMNIIKIVMEKSELEGCYSALQVGCPCAKLKWH